MGKAGKVKWLGIVLCLTFILCPEYIKSERIRQITFGDNPIGWADQGVNDAVLSRDGNRIFFQREKLSCSGDACADGYTNFSVSFDGEGLRMRTMPIPIVSLDHSDLSWDGSTIVFDGAIDPLGTNPLNHSQIFRMNWDETNIVQLTFTNDYTIRGNFQPRISADGSWILFSSNDDFTGSNPMHYQQFFVVNSDGTMFKQITNDSLLKYYQMGSDDLGVIVYNFKSGTTSEIMVTDAAGSFHRQITSNTVDERLESISGDGSLIAFRRTSSYPSRRNNIYTIKPDGTGETLVTSNTENINATLNGDGSIMMKVVYLGNYSTDIYIGPSDGSDFKRINPDVHGLQGQYLMGDMDSSGTRAVFSMCNWGTMPPNENMLSAKDLFAYDGSIGETPAGTDVMVSIDRDAKLTFSNVAAAGETSALISTVGLKWPADAGVSFGSPPLHYEFSTTASWSGQVEVCLGFAKQEFIRQPGSPVMLWQRDGDTWVDVTDSYDESSHTVCGSTNNLGEFVMAFQKRPDFYVSQLAGSDEDGDGSISNPWATIGHALWSIGRSDSIPVTVNVAEGIYQEKIKMNEYVSLKGGFHSTFLLRSADLYPTVLEGNGIGYLVVGADNTTIDGFTIENSRYGIYNEDASPVISNCRIQNNGYGIYNTAMVPNEQDTSPLIKNNIVVANSVGINSQFTMEDWCYSYPFGNFCPPDNTILDPLIVNNTITGNNTGVAGKATGQNNILWGNNNDFPPNDGPLDISYSNIESGLEGTGNISADPMFADPLNGDFHLLPGSPAIDAGNPDPAYNDLDGSRNDMGAYGGPDALIPQAIADTGSNVTVYISNGVTATFGQVTFPGTCSVNVNTSGPPTGTGLKLGRPPVYYDVSTSAVYTGPIEICINYDESNFQGPEKNLKLIHFISGGTTNVTTSLDTQANIICGTVDHLSMFAVAEVDNGIPLPGPSSPPAKYWPIFREGGCMVADPSTCTGYPDIFVLFVPGLVLLGVKRIHRAKREKRLK